MPRRIVFVWLQVPFSVVFAFEAETGSFFYPTISFDASSSSFPACTCPAIVCLLEVHRTQSPSGFCRARPFYPRLPPNHHLVRAVIPRPASDSVLQHATSSSIDREFLISPIHRPPHKHRTLAGLFFPKIPLLHVTPTPPPSQPFLVSSDRQRMRPSVHRSLIAHFQDCAKRRTRPPSLPRRIVSFPVWPRPSKKIFT